MDVVDWEMLITVGRIVRPHGIRGQVVVASETDFGGERFAAGATLFVRRDDRVEPLRVLASFVHQGRWVVGFETKTSMNDAEALRGAELRVPADGVRRLDVNQYYAYDLIGCTVDTVSGITVGLVERVDFGAGVPMLVVAGAQGEVLVPFAEDICRQVDPGARRIVIDPPDGLIDLNVRRPGGADGGSG
jgi:16S rRNA processing protein RimM